MNLSTDSRSLGRLQVYTHGRFSDDASDYNLVLCRFLTLRMATAADSIASISTAASVALPGIARILIAAGKLEEAAASELYRKAQAARTPFVSELMHSNAVSPADLAPLMSKTLAAPLIASSRGA